MDQHILKRKLQIIVFELTTPLVSLSGFCDLTRDRTKSQATLDQLRAISEATEYIKREKDFLGDKILIENDPDFSSVTKAANYLRNFAAGLQKYENTIVTSINQLLRDNFDTGDPSFNEWAERISTSASKNLSEKIGALKTIQSDLELIILKSRG